MNKLSNRVASRWLNRLAVDVDTKIQEIREGTPKEHLEEVVSNLRQYLKLRQLNGTQYQDLPDDLRQEIGTRDPADVFIKMMDDADVAAGFDDADKTFHDWNTNQLEELVDRLG